MGHRLVLGAPGSGKSEALKLWVLRWALAGDRSISVDDRHGSLVYELLGHLVAHGLEKRVVFERAQWTDKVLGWDFTLPSVETGERRIVDDRVRRQWWLQPTYAMAMLKDGIDKPWTRQYLEAAAGIFFGLPQRRRIDQVMKIFRRADPEGYAMIRATADREAAWYFEDLGARSEGRNLNTWAVESYASMRKLDYVTDPTVYLRDGGALNHRSVMKQKRIVLRDLSGVPMEAARALVILHENATVLAAQAEFEATGKPLPHTHVIDEAGVLDAATPMLLSNLQEARKWMSPGGFVLASQSVDDFRVRENFNKLLGYCTEHYWGYMASGIEEAADDLSAAAYDPNQILDERERLIHDGYDVIKRVSVSKSSGDRGETDSVSEGVHYLPRHRTVIDKVFADPQRQRADIKLSVAKKDPGHFTVRDMKGVRSLYEPLLGDAWALGLSRIRTDKAIDRLRNHPLLTSPRSWPRPSSPPSRPSAPPPHAEPSAPRTPKPPRQPSRKPSTPLLDATGEVIE